MLYLLATLVVLTIAASIAGVILLLLTDVTISAAVWASPLCASASTLLMASLIYQIESSSGARPRFYY